jgi:hypothetical protein
MTKDEAITAIIDVCQGPATWGNTKAAIKEIVGQIDPEPGAFSVREMCELLRLGNYVSAWPEETFTIWPSKIMAGDIDELRVKLTELATPPKPKTVMVPVPIRWAQWRAGPRDDHSGLSDDESEQVNAACASALAKLEQQP